MVMGDRKLKVILKMYISPRFLSDRSPDVDLSDDDEGPEDDDGWSNDEMSDSDQPMHEDDTRMRTRTRKSGRGPNRPAAINRVNNVVRLFLKRFFYKYILLL